MVRVTEVIRALSPRETLIFIAFNRFRIIQLGIRLLCRSCRSLSSNTPPLGIAMQGSTFLNLH